MRPQLRHVGIGRHPLVVIDGLMGGVEEPVRLAAELAPFPTDKASYYPGVRREITSDDVAACAYVDRVMNAAAPFLGGAFDCSGFSLIGASFSIVATDPRDLIPMQRSPHFDSPDPDYIALIHYLAVAEGTGTAFFRQRSTGIERVDEHNLDRFVETAKSESARLAPSDGYIQGSNHSFEELDRVEAVPDRLVFYQGGLLHSGIIPPGMALDPAPNRGRLTANFFLHLDRETVS